MKNNKKKRSSNGLQTNRSTPAAVIFAAGFATALAPAVRADVRIQPRVEIGAIYIDNVELTTTAAKESEMILQTTPGILIDVKSSRVTGKLDYMLSDYRYMEDGDRDQTYHQALGNATVVLMRELLDMNFNGSYTQTLVDPQRTINFQRLFDVGNVADRYTIGGGPHFHHKARGVEIESAYDFTRVDYTGTQQATFGTEGSNNKNFVLTLASDAEGPQRFLWGFNYNWRDVDYEVTPQYRYQTATLEAGYAVTRTLTLLVDGGRESDVTKSTSDGKLDSSLYHGGIRYTPGRLLQFEARAGHRFFGDSYRGSLQVRGRVLRAEVTYLEEPTTETELAGRPAAVIEPGAPVPPELIGLDRNTAEVFINRELRSEISLVGNKTEIVFSGSRQRREYINLNAQDTVLGAGIVVNRRLSPRLWFNTQGAYEKIDSRTGDESSYWTARMGLTYSLTPTASIIGEVFHVVEKTGFAAASADANAASIRFTKTFGRN
jgi:hypothetical protein